MKTFRNKSVDVHNFAMVPRADIPRSTFRMQHVHKTSFDAAFLVPIYVDEMLPGDTFNMRMTAFCRLATPIFPVMDNLHMETFFFFVPCRLLWDNWERFMGARIPNPDSSISFIVPTMDSPPNGYPIGSIYDYYGLPTVGQVNTGEAVHPNSLPLRAYNKIYNEWYRDQNLQDSVIENMDDGPDAYADYVLLRRGKRHDYFTGALPFVQKGDPAQINLGGGARVLPLGTASPDSGFTMGARADAMPTFSGGADSSGGALRNLTGFAANDDVRLSAAFSADRDLFWDPGIQASGLWADLSSATAFTINALRTSFQVQKLLERDARGGTRYTEIVRSHFGVVSPDARLQRPEYLGGGSSLININPIAQTSATTVAGSTSPQGTLSAVGTGLLTNHGFTYSATEHGYVIGLVQVRADLTYQQGLRRLWSRSTRYDFYFPAFAMLGEQAVLNKEIHSTGVPLVDDAVFGYQERWAEYRYFPSMITGLMRSTAANSINAWHYAQEFGALPVLNEEFIVDRTDDVVERSTAVGVSAGGQQFLFDAFFDNKAARPLPMYSVPGLVDHF